MARVKHRNLVLRNIEMNKTWPFPCLSVILCYGMTQWWEAIPEPRVICGLSLLSVLYSAPKGFSLGIPGFLSFQKPTFFKFQFDPGMHEHF